MGQRLCLTAYGANEKCYNIYVHWGGYTLSGLELAYNIIEITTTYCQEKYKLDWNKMTKYDYIEALLYIDCGMRINWFDQEFEKDKDYPELSKFCEEFIKKEFFSRCKTDDNEFEEIKKKIFDDTNLKAFTEKELVLKEKTFFELFRNFANTTDRLMFANYFVSVNDTDDDHLREMLNILYSVCSDANRNTGLIYVTEKSMTECEFASDGYFIDIDFNNRRVTDNISYTDEFETDDFREYINDNYEKVKSIIVCDDQTIVEFEIGYPNMCIYRNIYVDNNDKDKCLEDYLDINFEDLHSVITKYDDMERASCFAIRFLPKLAKTDPTKAFKNYGVFHLVA